METKTANQVIDDLNRRMSIYAQETFGQHAYAFKTGFYQGLLRSIMSVENAKDFPKARESIIAQMETAFQKKDNT